MPSRSEQRQAARDADKCAPAKVGVAEAAGAATVSVYEEAPGFRHGLRKDMYNVLQRVAT
jgi:hypothetical protein